MGGADQDLNLIAIASMIYYWWTVLSVLVAVSLLTLVAAGAVATLASFGGNGRRLSDDGKPSR